MKIRRKCLPVGRRDIYLPGSILGWFKGCPSLMPLHFQVCVRLWVAEEFLSAARVVKPKAESMPQIVQPRGGGLAGMKTWDGVHRKCPIQPPGTSIKCCS